jgi:hypothetical protein
MFRALVVGLSKYYSSLKAIAIMQNDTALSIPASAIAYPQQPIFGTTVFDQMLGEFADAQTLAILIEVFNGRHESRVRIEVLVVIVFVVRQVGGYNNDRIPLRTMLVLTLRLLWRLLLIAPTSTTARRLIRRAKEWLVRW